jgi:hypothetical protein
MSIPQPRPPVLAFFAEVRLVLSIAGQDLDLAEASPDDAVLRHARPISWGSATIITTINGRSQVRCVRIPRQADDLRRIDLSN